ncbi:MAG TPA: potassium channel family protein [Pseudolabrys sp.]|nr:potassium channel family protein [Pseudolabrys sp.]
MTAGRQTTLQRWQEQYSDQLLSVLTVLLILMMFVVTPLHAKGIKIAEAFGMIVALVMIAGVLVISASMTATAIMGGGFLLNAVVVIARLIKPLTYDLYLIAAAWFIIACTMGVVVGVTVFGPGRVTYHRIVGAVLLYLLIALAFVSLFTLVGHLVPDAFSGLVLKDDQKMASNLIYFSFVTLTTIGYGDIVPTDPIARSLCNLESIIGQLYPATLLARLVTLEIEERRR